jgi:antitoxin PrlF
MNKVVIPGGWPVTVKGQVTIPKPIRDRLGLTPGSEVEFSVEPDGRVVMRKAAPESPPEPDRFDRVAGSGTALKGMSTDEIMKLLRGDDD